MLQETYFPLKLWDYYVMHQVKVNIVTAKNLFQLNRASNAKFNKEPNVSKLY